MASATDNGISAGAQSATIPANRPLQPLNTVNISGNPESGTGGLYGVWRTVGNFSGITAIMVFAFMMRSDLNKRMDQFIVESKDERTMYRDELAKLRNTSDERTGRMEIIHQKAFDSLGTKIERACLAMESAANKIKEDHKPNANTGGGCP